MRGGEPRPSAAIPARARLPAPQDDLSVHEALRSAVGRRLICAKELPASGVTMVRAGQCVRVCVCVCVCVSVCA